MILQENDSTIKGKFRFSFYGILFQVLVLVPGSGIPRIKYSEDLKEDRRTSGTISICLDSAGTGRFF